ncbi:MAG: tRNA pseudouridine(38-40) synthase TruA, partial [Candidatus Cybelea sp.]
MDRGDARGLRHDARSRVPTRLCRGEDRAAPSKPLTNLRLTVEYDGTDFCGFQWQPESRTVAGVLTDVLKQLFGEPVKVTGAGRTDSGVHASGQVVSFKTEASFPFERFLAALRGSLPPDCSARDVMLTDDNFSARFSARERTYVYVILNRPQPSALVARYAYHQPQRLDLPAMRTAAAALVGERDFRSFCAAPPDEGTVRTLRRLEIESRGELIRIEVAAGGFLHHMVRTIVGTLIECGTGRREPAEMSAILA